MTDNDQSLKSLLLVLLEQFFVLFLPKWATKFDFSSIDWLPQELFPDPPDGERRQVDLLCKLRTLVPILFGGVCSDLWVAIVHIEIEGRDSVQDFGRRAFRYYVYIRDKYNLPVLPIVIFLHVGLDGIGVAVYKENCGFSAEPESPENLNVLTFRYLYVGLPKLDALQYLDSGSELGVALASLMKLPADKKAWFKAEALQRLTQSPLDAGTRELLTRFVEMHVPLEGPEAAEFDRLLAQEPYVEVRRMATTFFDKGLEKGREEGLEKGLEKGREEGLETGTSRLLLLQLERRFGPLSDRQKRRVAEMSLARREEVACDLLTASSLESLGLGT